MALPPQNTTFQEEAKKTQKRLEELTPNVGNAQVDRDAIYQGPPKGSGEIASVYTDQPTGQPTNLAALDKKIAGAGYFAQPAQLQVMDKRKLPTSYTYEHAVLRSTQRDVKTPEEAKLIQEALARGKNNMAEQDGTNNLSVTPPDDRLKGKTGEELQKAILQEQAGQAEATTLPDEKKVQVSKIDVKPDEVLDSEQYGMKEDRSVEMPGTIDAEKFRVERPEAVDAATYDASTVGDVGKVDAAQGKVSEEAQIKAAQGTLSPEALAEEVSADLDPRATTQYQLAELFKTIKDGGELPAWAAPAVRNVSAVMAQRGLGSSSMAAAAMTQAVMEQGINIATQDANKYATIQLQNLTAKQQTTLSNAAAIANMDLTNLNNRQIAAVNNAKAFLSIDVQNLNNEQQAATLNYQTTVSAMLTDAAQQNAAKQFNAKSQNEIEQFFQELGSQIENQTMNRVANLEQYNISQKTAVEQFNANQLSARDQFNANMRTQIDQSNAVWRRNVNTANTSLQNEANRINVQTLLGLTNAAQNNLWQLYRDQAQWAMSTSENNLDRAHNAAMQAAAISANASIYDEKFDNFLLVKTIDNIFN